MTQYNPQLGYYKATTAELISGVRAVSINSSGNFVIAKAGTATTMPAVGVAKDNLLSGQVYKVFSNVDAVVSISGTVGGPIYVGPTGPLVNGSGSLLSGNMIQMIGVASTSGAYIN